MVAKGKVGFDVVKGVAGQLSSRLSLEVGPRGLVFGARGPIDEFECRAVDDRRAVSKRSA